MILLKSCTLYCRAVSVLKSFNPGGAGMQGLQELCREFPQLKGPLMEERAQYTVAVMRSLATRCALHTL